MDWIKLRTLDCGCLEQEYMFMYGLVALLRPSIIVEIGTGHGGSSLVMGSSLKDNEIDGKVISLDISARESKEAKQHAEEFGISSYIEYLTGDRGLIDNITNISLAFIDGNHFEGCQPDWGAVKNKARVTVFHDAQSSLVPEVIENIGRQFDVTVFNFSGFQYIRGTPRWGSNWELAVVTKRWTHISR